MVTRETDYIQQLANYIKKNLSKGYTLDSLKTALEHQGYSRTSIDRAIKLSNEQLAKQAPEIKEKPIIKYEVVSKTEEPFKKSIWQRIKKLFG